MALGITPVSMTIPDGGRRCPARALMNAAKAPSAGPSSTLSHSICSLVIHTRWCSAVRAPNPWPNWMTWDEARRVVK
jgi:hypothetical protein